VISSVERRRTFADLRTDGRRVRHGAVRLNHLPLERLGPDAPRPQVAFAIGRSFGGAVERNRGRRRLRAAFVEAWRRLPLERVERLGGAYLLSGSRALLRTPFERLVGDVERCLDAVDRAEAGSRQTAVAR
jgi:ribonuclease P protein component